MNKLSATIEAELWWLLPAAVLAAVIGWELDWGRSLRLRAPEASPIEPKPVVTALLPDYAIAGGIDARAETVGRTLFNPTRRPAPVAVAEAARPRMQRGLYALTGTTVFGDKGLAFLKEKSGGKALTVRQGDTIAGMLVAEVKPDRVKLTLGDESEEVVLAVATNSRPTPQPAAPAPAAGAPATPQPAAPPMPAVSPVAAGGQPQPAQSLAERRQAARAAAAAAGASSQPAQPPAAAAAAPGGNPDPGWAQVYQRYQQRRQQQQ